MAYRFIDRLKYAWNAFTSRDPTEKKNISYYYGNSYRPDRRRNFFSADNSIIEMVKNRISVDASQIDIKHIRTDEEDNYKEDLDSSINEVIRTSANIDQTGRAFMLDLIQSILDEGVAAAVPIDTDMNPLSSESYKIYSIRVGKIVEWYPYSVKVECYNERTGKREEIVVPKETTAIIENPFYSIMNAPNSTLQRLIRTLRNLDVLNDRNSSGKLDLIIQLPYSLKSPLKQQQAEGRRKQIEMQLMGSQYGIAYIDAAEHVTQLNRPLENNLWKEASDLTALLFNQLGLTQSVFDGTASEETMNNYYIRTIYPILTAITEEMERKFLSKTARSQHQRIRFMRDPFMFTGMKDMSTVIQTLIQNEVMSSNEGRSRIGLKPKDTERANDLLNKNINKVEDLSEIKEKPVEDADDNIFKQELVTSNNAEEDKDG